MTNDDLKRFYPINEASNKKEDFVRYDGEGKIPGDKGDNLRDLNFKDAWVSGSSYNLNDLVYVDSSNTRTFYLAINNISESTVSPATDTAHWKSWFSTSSGVTIAAGVEYLTTAPTEANTDGLKFVLLNAEPETRYDGYVYFIMEA